MTNYEAHRIPGDGELEDAFDVRRDVFIDEQDVSEAEEWDGLDENSIHYVVYDDVPIGTARLRTPGEGVAKVERVAVRRDYRGEGIGRQLMALLESEAREAGCSTVLLHAQTAVEGFYQRLGYETTSDEFLEADILHVVMEKSLE
jgi:predicted GNAT family N-acyltransferase